MDREHTIPQAGGGGRAQWTLNIKNAQLVVVDVSSGP